MHMHRYADNQVAQVCHAVIIGLQAVHQQEPDGDAPSPSGSWSELDLDLRQTAIEGVRKARNGGIPSPREHHDWWVQELYARGWKCGPRDPAAKMHPNLVSWPDLPPDQQDKDRLFLAVVTAMTVS